MKSRAESMRRVAAVAKKNLRPVAEMVVMDNSSLIRTKMTSDAVHDFVDDITHCLVGVYEGGVDRQAKAVTEEAKKKYAVYSCLSRLWAIPAVRVICADDLVDDVQAALRVCGHTDEVQP